MIRDGVSVDHIPEIIWQGHQSYTMAVPFVYPLPPQEWWDSTDNPFTPVEPPEYEI